MNKKICMMVTIVVLIVHPIITWADDIDEEEANNEEISSEIMQTLANASNEPLINSKSAIVIDRESKRILYSKNANEKRAMASTTKIMTCIIALENSKLDELVTVSKNAASVGGSRLGLNSGDKITMLDLLYGLMLRSGNDAAAQVAETLGGSYVGFARLMNKKAEELGLKNTHYVTPHGLDNDEHYTTAYELAILTDYALNNKKFAEIVGTKEKTILINGKQRELYNTNELLGVLNGVNGVKTGFTFNAGRCLVVSCKRDDMNLVSVVLGADTKKFRTKDSVQILEYAYKNYSYINLKEIIEETFETWKKENRIKVVKGEKEYLEPVLEYISLEKFPVKKGEESSISINFDCKLEEYAPIYQFEKLGTVKVSINNEDIIEIKIVSRNNIDKKTWMDYIKEIVIMQSLFLIFVCLLGREK